MFCLQIMLKMVALRSMFTQMKMEVCPPPPVDHMRSYPYLESSLVFSLQVFDAFLVIVLFLLELTLSVGFRSVFV